MPCTVLSWKQPSASVHSMGGRPRPEQTFQTYAVQVVIHASAVLKDATLQQHTASDLRAVFVSKLIGAQRLLQHDILHPTVSQVNIHAYPRLTQLLKDHAADRLQSNGCCQHYASYEHTCQWRQHNSSGPLA